MTYSKFITLKKMLYQGVMVFLSGGIAAVINFMEAQTPETNVAVFAVILILMKGTENYLKHKSD